MSPKLTPRQRLVESLTAAGCSSQQIAAELQITVKSVKNHRNRASRKRRMSFAKISPQ